MNATGRSAKAMGTRPYPTHPITDPAVGTRCVSGEVEHVVQGQQARGHAL